MRLSTGEAIISGMTFLATRIRQHPTTKSTAIKYTKSSEHLLNRLDHARQIILMLRYGLRGKPSQTLDRRQQTLRHHEERVRQIQNNAIEKLKTLIRAYV